MQTNPVTQLGFIIHDVARLLRWNFDRRAQKLGLSRAQWSVLSHLRRQDGVRQNYLADLMDVQPITLGRQLDRLEKAGWVKRQGDPDDRRARNIYLTEGAAPILLQMEAIGQETCGLACTDISSADLDVFVDVLKKMRSNLCGEKDKGNGHGAASE